VLRLLQTHPAKGALIPRPALCAGFRVFNRASQKHMTLIAYLDEFGHIGPFVSRSDKRHNDHPVFGLAGIVIPVEQVRSFATWFYQRKCQLLKWEIDNQSQHPATWEKKGSALYTRKNVSTYSELRQFTNRFLNKIKSVGGFVFYVGIHKHYSPDAHDANKLYLAVLREAIKRLDQHCASPVGKHGDILIVMDEHEQRSELVNEAARVMFNPGSPRDRIIEPPFQAESHRYQTLQAADWIAGLVGRISAVEAEPAQFQEFEVHQKYFHSRLLQASMRSSVRAKDNGVSPG